MSAHLTIISCKEQKVFMQLPWKKKLNLFVLLQLMVPYQLTFLHPDTLKKLQERNFWEELNWRTKSFLNKKFWTINPSNYDSNTMSCDLATCKIHPVISRVCQTVQSENHRFFFFPGNGMIYINYKSLMHFLQSERKEWTYGTIYHSQV